MGNSKVIGFDAAQLKKDLTTYWTDFQTKELISYADEKCKEIGNKILSYNSKNHLDRTGNLLNSLCWGVTYDKNLKGSGFFRDPVTRTRVNKWGEKRGYGIQGTKDAALHEFSYDIAEIVNGRKLAEEFLSGRVPYGANKWTVFFAILAPYWGYWESGFKMVKTGAYYKFAVMTQVYDEVKKELKNPQTMNFTVTQDRFYTFTKEGDYVKGRYKLNKRGR